MKSRLLKLLLAAALAVTAPFVIEVQSAHAAGQVLCSPEVAVGNTGPRRVVNTSSTSSPQPAYSLNPVGCAYIAQADVGFFLSQGYTSGPDSGSILFTTGVQTGTTDLVVGSVPANAYISAILVGNSTANAVTGGIDFATTANGTDVVSALTCGANCVSSAPGTVALAKSVFSTTAATPIHAAAHAAGSWNSSNINITIVYRYF